MAEIDAATGKALKQHIHINNEPVAELSTAPDSQEVTPVVHYVHADHLGTPVLLSNKNGKVVADIEATPFGETFMEYNAVNHQRRFPGQYKDEESGLHYNYFRDYDPSVGRYIQSDPIGLNGGLNIFSYSQSDPVLLFDPLGLYIPTDLPPNCWLVITNEGERNENNHWADDPELVKEIVIPLYTRKRKVSNPGDWGTMGLLYQYWRQVNIFTYRKWKTKSYYVRCREDNDCGVSEYKDIPGGYHEDLIVDKEVRKVFSWRVWRKKW